MSGNSNGMNYDNEVVEENRLECRRLLEQRKTLYEDDLRKINDELGTDGTEVKLKLMQSYISDLEEQNAMFLQTVDALLEKSAASARNEQLKDMQIGELQSDLRNFLELIRRVREENSLDTTGLTFSEVTHKDIFGTEDLFHGLTVGSINDSQISAGITISVETAPSTHQNQSANEDLLHTQVENLRNDLTNLLELIRRVREGNSWDTTGLTFNEVTCEDILGTVDIFYDCADDIGHDSQIAESIIISVETTHSTHQNQDEGADSACYNDKILRLHRDVERSKSDRERDMTKLIISTVLFDFQRTAEERQAFRNEMWNKYNEHVTHGPDEKIYIRYWRSQDDVRLECHNLHRRHSSANPHL